MIKAGNIKDIQWSNGNWLIFDIGFSNNKKSSALLFNNNKPNVYQYNEAVTKVIELIRNHATVNLVIEAPLSIAFDRKGNPKGRIVEKKGQRTRYWYFGPGCTVLVATTHFMRKLVDSKLTSNVRLFEGFVSYKEKGNISDHLRDVQLLKKAIMSRNPLKYYIEPHELKLADNDILESAFKVAKMDFCIPPVIQGIP